MKSLFNICLSVVSQQTNLTSLLIDLPSECKQLVLEWLCAHDLLNAANSIRLMAIPGFGGNLTRLHFYLSDQVSDGIVSALARCNKRLEQITFIHCPLITDIGVLNATSGQNCLNKLELRSLKNVTSRALTAVRSKCLQCVDLSGCPLVTSDGVIQLLLANPNIRSLCLSSCRHVDDLALYAVGNCLGPALSVLSLDFLPSLRDPSSCIFYLTQHCPNLQHLSLCRYFNPNYSFDTVRIDGSHLKELDLYGNFFVTLPELPESVLSLRLSCSGEEDVQDFVRKLRLQHRLRSLCLQLTCPDTDSRAVDHANHFIIALLSSAAVANKLTKLHLSVSRLSDRALSLISERCVSLRQLAFDVEQLNTGLLQKYFSGGHRSRAGQLLSLKVSRLRVTHRVLFAIARGSTRLQDLETSHMTSVDDRFLSLLATNCHMLRSVNFNGCKHVTDKGMSALARGCPLSEVRIRATSVTDNCVYVMAQFCPNLEWIAHADFSGRPKFTEKALNCLRQSCVQRVIC